MTTVDDGTMWLTFANERVKVSSEVNNVIIDQQHNPFEGELGTTGQDTTWPAPAEEEADDQSSSNEDKDHGIMIV